MSESPNGYATGYDDTHRTFLQAFLAQQVMTVIQAQTLLTTILTTDSPNRGHNLDREDLLDHINTVNGNISPFDLEIRSAKHQKTQEEIYALVNTTSDALTQLATTHKSDEIEFVKRVLDAMFEEHNSRQHEIMAVTSMQALKLAKPRDGQRGAALTGMQAEHVMESLVEEGWFEWSKQGFYSLTPRALLELREWLADTYNDEDEERIKNCQTCKETVTVGQRCSDLDCPARMHTVCAGRNTRIQGGENVCPVCKKSWAEALPVGERAARIQRQSNGRRADRTQVDD